MSYLSRLIPLALVAVLALLVPAPPVAAQGLDTEPNNTCPEAHDLGTVTLPFTLTGRLDTAPGSLDVDFFRISANPGTRLSLSLEGDPADGDPLFNSRIGAFGSGCGQLDAISSFGPVPARLTVTVPFDGRLVIAATGAGDTKFLGGGIGDYRLHVGLFEAAGSIRGRLIDAETGAPISTDFHGFGSVQLQRCSEVACSESVTFQSTDSEGRFLLEADYDGAPLEAGSYRITATASIYETLIFGPFSVAKDEHLDLGDLAMTPLMLIGSIRGRLVDSLDGTPLPGINSPFSVVLLETCLDFGCFVRGFTSPDEQGRFAFTGRGSVLEPGTYRLSAWADQYLVGSSETFEIAADESFDAGSFGLQRLRVQFTGVEPCEIPPEGGLCEIHAQIHHRGGERFDGAVWVQVNASIAESPSSTVFQIGRLGAVNPMPEKLNLKAGEVTSLDFQLEIPGDLEGRAFFCFTAQIGEEPAPLFHRLTSRFLFCLDKQPQGFVEVPEEEARRRLREAKNLAP